MKHCFLLLNLLFAGILLANTDTPVIHFEEADSRPKVENSGRLSVVPMAGVRNDSGVPKGSTAGRLAVNNQEFLWTPSQLTGKATGGADLTSVCLSDDETALLFTERIGGKDKPNSTRLLLLNTRNGKIIRSVLLSERRLSQTIFIPASDHLLAIEQAQKEFDTPDALVKINLKRGAIVSRTPAAGGEITSFCSDGNKAWYTVKGKSFIYEINLEEMGASPVPVRTLVETPNLVITPDQQTVIVYGPGKIEKYKTSADKKLALMQTLESPAGFSPSQALVIDDTGFMMLLVEPDKKAVLFKGATTTELAEKPAGFQALYRKDNHLFYGMLKHNAIGRIALPGTDLTGRPVVPGKLKPVSKNVTWKMFVLSGTPCKMLLIDTRGNVSQMEVTKRRWKKSNLLIVDKTGMK